jgi:hypothetical protein
MTVEMQSPLGDGARADSCQMLSSTTRLVEPGLQDMVPGSISNRVPAAE